MLNKKVYLRSLGCPRNLVDSEVIVGLLLKAGCEMTPSIEEGDLLIVNSCSFLQSARDETVEVLQELFQRKKNEGRVVVVGCMVNLFRKDLEELFPEVQCFLSSGQLGNIVSLLEKGEQNRTLSATRSFLETPQTPRVISTSYYAYLKIAEGCSKHCSFCLIPQIKGPLRSKAIEQVVQEFHQLLSQGIFEIVLVAQDLGDYGKDRKEKKYLHQLLKEILKCKEFFWLRLLYLYPDEIDEELLDLLTSDSRICSYLDIPMQHVNDQILRLMKRNSSKKQIVTLIEKIRKRIPNLAIRTSLIVGFPGETEEIFLELRDFVRDYSLDHVGFFSFSAEKGVLASHLKGQVEENVKKARIDQLAEIQKHNVIKRNQKRIGERFEVLVEGKHPDSPLLLRGRFQGQAPEVDGEIILNDWRKVNELGRLYQVECTDVCEYDMLAKVVRKV